MKSENRFVPKLPEEKNAENLEETFEAPEPLVTGDLFPEDFFPSAKDENKSLDEAEIKIGNLQDQLDDGNCLKLFLVQNLIKLNRFLIPLINLNYSNLNLSAPTS